jgi:hypothetical protein
MREQHELSKAFPPMSDEEFLDLKDSIENIGVQMPIVIYEEKVIDGWHRYTAANEVGMSCPETDLPDDVDPRDFVLANNKTRRHLNKGQLAISYTRVYEWYPSGINKGCLLSRHPKTNKELAQLSGTSRTSIEHAKTLLTKGDKEVVEAVDQGKISLRRGAQISKLDKGEQAKAIAEPSEPKPSILDGHLPSDDEIKANELAMQADLDEVNRFLESDDKMAGLWEENKKLRFLNSQLEVRNAALMNEKNECIKLCKKLHTQVYKLFKAKK